MTRDSRRLQRFLAAYQAYVRRMLQPTQEEIRGLLRQWRRPEHW